MCPAALTGPQPYVSASRTMRSGILGTRTGGPTAGRPLVDRVKGSRFQNMKELRPPSSGQSEIRMLFAFDPAREAIILVAGDKSGRWDSWYRTAIPLADERFAEHLITLKEEGDE